MKYIWWIIGAVVLVGVLVLVVMLRPMASTPTMDANTQPDTSNVVDTPPMTNSDNETPNTVEVPAAANPSTDVPAPVVLASGRYQDYSSELVDDSGYQTTILFFYAGWCPECRGYDKAIEGATLPPGVQILQVNYDDAQDLRQKYGVTIQSSFVRVDAAGNKQVLWSGLGKEKSLDAILENTK